MLTITAPLYITVYITEILCLQCKHSGEYIDLYIKSATMGYDILAGYDTSVFF